jgi:hypothetical protein
MIARCLCDDRLMIAHCLCDDLQLLDVRVPFITCVSHAMNVASTTTMMTLLLTRSRGGVVC